MKGSGAEICLEINPRGKPIEGYIYGTLKPGTLLQVRNTALVNGRMTFEAYAPGQDGHQRGLFILLPDQLQGKTASDAYVSGTRCFVHACVSGEEFNVLYKASAGALTIGKPLCVDSGTGKTQPQVAVVADYATGGLDTEAKLIAAINALKNRDTQVSFVSLEVLSDPAEDTLVHAMCVA